MPVRGTQSWSQKMLIVVPVTEASQREAGQMMKVGLSSV
jgi:hypothetical protein